MASTTKDDEALMLLWDAHFADLNDMAEADIMEGVDLPKFRTDRALFMASVKTEAGRRRLAAAKDAQSNSRAADVLIQPTVSVAQAREWLKQAANDHRITMAARGLDEMSDETILRAYARLSGLLAQNPGDAGS